MRASIPKLLLLLALLSVSLLLLFFSIKEEMMTLKDKYNLHVISHYKTSAKGVRWHLYFCIFYTCFNPSRSKPVILRVWYNIGLESQNTILVLVAFYSHTWTAQVSDFHIIPAIIVTVKVLASFVPISCQLYKLMQ